LHYYCIAVRIAVHVLPAHEPLATLVFVVIHISQGSLATRFKCDVSVCFSLQVLIKSSYPRTSV